MTALAPAALTYNAFGLSSNRVQVTAKNDDGSTTVYFAPSRPDGVKAGNWVQTDPKKGWNTLLRLYSPLEPFFTKSWRPSEIEPVANK